MLDGFQEHEAAAGTGYGQRGHLVQLQPDAVDRQAAADLGAVVQ